MAERLYRSRHERMIGGVAGGIAENLRVDPTLIRIAWVVLAFATGGAAVILYIVLMLVIPEAPGSPAPGSGTPEAGRPDGDDATTAAMTTSSPATGSAGGWAPSTAAGSDASPTWRAGRRSGGASGPLVLGVGLVLVGGYLLLRQYVPQLNLELGWPFVAVALGVVLIVVSLRPRSSS